MLGAVDVSLAGRLRAALAGRYTVERELGRGGMAVVYLARDVKHDRLVAVKVLRPEVSTSLGPERFLREISLAARLAHPHIVPLHDSGEAGGLLYYVMPYVEGETLRARLDREHRLDPAAAVALTREVADALDYAHRQGVVHRDIKPENILLEAGHAVVTDFGIARAISVAGSRITTAGFALGTPEYMSPEQAAGESAVDGRSDLYSLGCVLFETLTGRTPFGGDPRRVMAQQVGTPVEAIRKVVPGVSADVAAALERALAKAPEDRFTTAGAFAAALGGGRQPLRRATRRRLVVSGALVVLVAAAVMIWTSLRRPVTPPLDPTHVAVLYFDDLSGDHSLGPTAAGLTEDLIDALADVPALTVVSPNGVRPYLGSRAAPESIARALHVGTLIAGSVARSGGRLRVSARLIDGMDGRQVASVALPDRPLQDLFRIQDSLTSALADALRTDLGQAITVQARKAGTADVRAWDLVRRADALMEDSRALLRLGDDAGGAARLHGADSLLASASEVDRRWTDPLLERGRVSLSLALLALEGPDGTRGFVAQIERGLGYTARALALGPGAPAALELRGILRYRLWQFGPGATDSLVRQAEGDLRAAVGAEGGRARAWATLSDLLLATGRFAEADQAGRRALAADAYLTEGPSVIADLFTTMLHRERFTEARDWCTQGRARYPTDPNLIDCPLRILGWSGEGHAAVDSAWRLLAALDREDSLDRASVSRLERRLLVGMVLARSGERDSARAVLRRTRAGVADSIWDPLRQDEAYIDLLIGDRDEALRQLTRIVQGSPETGTYLARNPWFRALQGDPRFQRLTGASGQ